MVDWDYIVPKDEKIKKYYGLGKHPSGSPQAIHAGKKGAKAKPKDAAKREWIRARGRKKEGRSKKWWTKWGKKKGAMSNPQAALEAAEVNDPSALAIFSRRVLLAAMAKTEHPTLRKRLKGAILRK